MHIDIDAQALKISVIRGDWDERDFTFARSEELNILYFHFL